MYVFFYDTVTRSTSKNFDYGIACTVVYLCVLNNFNQ